MQVLFHLFIASYKKCIETLYAPRNEVGGKIFTWPQGPHSLKGKMSY